MGWTFTFCKDLEAGNDTRLHCLGTVEPLGFCFDFFHRHYDQHICADPCCLLFALLFPVYRFGGLMTRDTYCFLATGAVAGWVWLRAKLWDAELFSLFEIDILGVSRGFWARYRPYMRC